MASLKLRPLPALALVARASSLSRAGVLDVPIEYANFGVDDRIDNAVAGMGSVSAGASMIASLAFPAALVGVAAGMALFTWATLSAPTTTITPATRLTATYQRCPPGFSVRRCIHLAGLRADHVVYLSSDAFAMVNEVLTHKIE